MCLPFTFCQLTISSFLCTPLVFFSIPKCLHYPLHRDCFTLTFHDSVTRKRSRRFLETTLKTCAHALPGSAKLPRAFFFILANERGSNCPEKPHPFACPSGTPDNQWKIRKKKSTVFRKFLNAPLYMCAVFRGPIPMCEGVSSKSTRFQWRNGLSGTSSA